MKNVFKRKERPLGQSLARAAAGSVLAVAALGGMVVVQDYIASQAVLVAPEGANEGDVMDLRKPAKGSPAAVLAKHPLGEQCWTEKDEPLADLPGHAIVQFDSGKTIYTGKHALVDAAFNEALAAIGYADHRDNLPFSNVIALCK